MSIRFLFMSYLAIFPDFDQPGGCFRTRSGKWVQLHCSFCVNIGSFFLQLTKLLFEFLDLFTQVVHALDYLHSQLKVIHRGIIWIIIVLY